MIAALNIKIDIGVVIAHIDFIDQIVYQSPPEFQVLNITLQNHINECFNILFGEFLSALYNEAGFYFFQVGEQHFAFLHTLFDALFQ